MSNNRLPRAAARLLAIAALAVAGVVGTAASASANSGGTVNTGGGNANLRSGPGTNYSIVGSIADGSAVSVYCIGYGTSITGPFGTTTVWDEIGGGRWITDAFVNTGTNAPIAMPCSDWNGFSAGSGSIITNDVPGCDFSNGGGGSNYGTANDGPDWSLKNDGFASGCSGAYYWTWGNGANASGVDYTRWGYYPGAYARCTITMHIPRDYSSSPFTGRAHYTIYTNHASPTAIGSATIDQSAAQGQDVTLGTWSADGTGYLRVRMDDSSTATGQLVIANSATFSCTGSY